MSQKRLIAALAASAGVILIVIAIVYFAQPAHALPGFFPGHEAGSNHHHTKHGLAALVVGLAAFVLAWFRSAPARTPTA